MIDCFVADGAEDLGGEERVGGVWVKAEIADDLVFDAGGGRVWVTDIVAMRWEKWLGDLGEARRECFW